MKQRVATRTITIRLYDDTEKELEFLSDKLNMSKTDILNNLIMQEYAKYETEPTYKEAVEALNDLREYLNKFNERMNGIEKGTALEEKPLT